MASAVAKVRSDAELAICRLVEETKGHETLKYLGPGCLVNFSDNRTLEFLYSTGKAPNTERAPKYYLVASGEVLKKAQLEALEKRKTRTVKIVAEFVGLKDQRTLERKPLSELYRSLEDDVIESHGMIYVALTKLKISLFSKSNLLNRALEVAKTEDEHSSTPLTSNELHCTLFSLLFSGKRERAFTLRENSELRTREYDLLQFDSVLTREESRFSSFFLRNDEKTRFLMEDEFPEDEIPFGAIILKDVKFVGVLNFDNRKPFPIIVGDRSGTSTANEENDKREKETPVGASGGIDPFLDPKSKSEVRPEAGDKAGIHCFSQPSATPSTGSQFVTGLNSANGNNGNGDLALKPSTPSPEDLLEEKKHSEEKGPGEERSPIENSFRSGDFDKGLDLKGTLYVTNLPPTNGEKRSSEELSAADLSHQMEAGGSGPEVQGATATAQEFQGAQAAQGLQVTTVIQRNQVDPVSQGYQVPSTAQAPQVSQVAQQPQIGTEIQRNPQGAPEATLASGAEGYQMATVLQNVHEAQGTSTHLKAHANGVLPQDSLSSQLPEDHNSEGRRCSFPGSVHPRKEEHPQVKRTISAPLETKRKFKLDDPLSKTMLSSLDLFEAVCRCLDKEYKYGQCKCWKHLAEFFGILEEEYGHFEYQQILSPTELMFEYLQTADPDFTIGGLKDGLRKIERLDVIGILVKHEKCDPSTLNDETLVCSLFDSDPDIIGEIAYLLDIQKSGVKNWSSLAPKLNITRKTFKSFENCSSDNPTEKLFEILIVHFPKLTVGELIDHLEAIKRRDVIKAIEKSTRVKKTSVVKELFEDVDVMSEVCDLLNQINRNNKVYGLRHLGNRLKIQKETLDDLLPTREETKSPTEALIRRLGGSNPSLILLDLVWALHEISRPDVIMLLNEYLPAGRVPNFLASSCTEICEICKQVLPKPLSEES